MAWLKNIKEVGKYLPYIWLGAKVLWSMYKAKVRQEGFRDALKRERDKRIEAERSIDLANRLGDSTSVRRERIRKEAEARDNP